MHTMSDATITIRVPGNHLMGALLGEHDRHLRRIEEALPDADITVRGNEVHLSGPGAPVAATLFEELVVLAERASGSTIARSIGRSTWCGPTRSRRPCSPTRSSGPTRARSFGQSPQVKAYVEAIAANVVTFGIGPAGTGKSWLAVAMAVRALQQGEVDRIILTRPAVEAGERLGFLPGDMMAKVDPYLRPLYDALHDMVGNDGMERLLDRGIVEVAPLAFMRGRTLNSSFIILDEAQNTTPEQMKMFLTRIGFGSKAVVTGDVTQVDVQGGRSGLGDLERVLVMSTASPSRVSVAEMSFGTASCRTSSMPTRRLRRTPAVPATTRERVCFYSGGGGRRRARRSRSRCWPVGCARCRRLYVTGRDGGRVQSALRR